MKPVRRLTLALVAFALAACAGEAPAPTGSAIFGNDNPLLAEWRTDFGVPPFDLIKNEHYLPAMREAMAAHKKEIVAIVANPEPPTFQNTIEALERSGELYARASRVFSAVTSANTNDTLQDVERTLAPEEAAHGDDILLNADLYKKVQAIWDRRDSLGLDPEQLQLLTETNKQFVRSGAALPDSAKARLRELNKELAELSQKYSENVLEETNAYELHVTDTTDLGNLPASLVELAASEAKRRGHDSGWSFTLQRPSINPFLESSTNRDLRKNIFDGYAMRGDNGNERDNKAIASRMAALRAERAKLLGYPTHAAYVLSDNMAETPERVMGLLDQVWRPALDVAKRERADMQALMNGEGVAGKLEGWDWRHYTEKVRRERYALDQQAILPYFEVNAVRDGVFMVASKLYGLTFVPRNDLPKWHPDQQVFEVKEADGRHLGMLYMDFFARPSKQGGAWMNDLQEQSKLDGEKAPIVTTNFNFPAPTAEGISLITFDDAVTMAHECGHALHGLLSNVTYGSLSGTNVARDFVEFGSQIMENWMEQPDVLRMYAKHYKTGEVIPDSLVEKLQASATFNQGFITVEFVAAAYLDMAWHLLTTPEEKEARSFEAAEMTRIGLIPEIVPRYRSTYFTHIFAGGYSAGYYAYLWAEVLDKDAFQAFVETGNLFDPATAKRLREEILSKGNTRPGMELYRAFRGRDPSIEPLLKARGLLK